MDPLSISASIVALLGAAGAVANGLQKLRSTYHASSSLLALINELSDLQVVLSSLSSIVADGADTPFETTQIAQNLVQLLNRATSVTQKTKETIDACMTDSKVGPRVSRRRWLRRQHSLKLLQEEIRVINQSLSMALSTAVYSGIRHIELRLEEVSVISEADRSTEGEQHDLGLQILQSDSTNQQHLVMTPPANCGIDTLLSPHTDTGNAMKQGGTVCIKATHVLPGGCRRNCTCQCHRRSTLRTPRLSQRLLGSLFLNYIGVPRQRDACSAKCQNRRGFNMRVTYLFPHWFLMRKFSAIVTSESGGPCLSIRLSRQISPNSEVFRLCRLGDVEGVKRLFTDGMASPFDVSAQTGSTLLTHAVMGRHGDTCAFLVNIGADPFAENMFGSRPIDDALDLILTSQLETDVFERYFVDGSHYEEKRFSMIHKVATEICPLDLATVLEASDIAVDTRDTDGRTPLAWAAGRRNLAILQTLLSFGADPNTVDHLQAVPLLAAVKSGTTETVSVLLKYGADVNARDHWGNTPLHVAALRQRDNDMALLLLSAGAQLDPRDRSGWTPLSAAIFWRLGPMVRLLVEHGANVNNRDNDGITPLLQAVWLNNHEAIALLLCANADTLVTSKDRRSLFHFAAEFSDVDALKLLTTGVHTKPNLEQCDSRGNTIRALFDARRDVSLDLVNAFTTLLITTGALPPPSRRFTDSPKSFRTAASFVSSDSWEDAVGIIKTEISQEKLKSKRKRSRAWFNRCIVM